MIVNFIIIYSVETLLLSYNIEFFYTLETSLRSRCFSVHKKAVSGYINKI